MRRHIPLGSDRAPYELKQLLIHNVMFYIFPPLNEISLFEFEVRIIFVVSSKKFMGFKLGYNLRN